MKERLLKLTQHEYNPKRRLAALLLEAIVFMVVIPAALKFGSPPLDRALRLPHLNLGAVNLLLGTLMIAVGWLFSMWAIVAQFRQGRGTPAPFMATPKLVTDGPYGFCRNPMALGAIVFYLGIALWLGSIGALAMVALPTAILLVYIRVIEEQEMEARFGEKYLEYRKRTPFLLPWFGPKR